MRALPKSMVTGGLLAALFAPTQPKADAQCPATAVYYASPGNYRTTAGPASNLAPGYYYNVTAARSPSPDPAHLLKRVYEAQLLRERQQTAAPRHGGTGSAYYMGAPHSLHAWGYHTAEHKR
jgi:hypothetical protein